MVEDLGKPAALTSEKRRQELVSTDETQTTSDSTLYL